MTRVLIADCCDESRVNTKRILNEIGDVTVFEAKTGGHALDLAREVLPEKILADMLLPGLDGIEVLASARESGLERVAHQALCVHPKMEGIARFLLGRAPVSVLIKPLSHASVSEFVLSGAHPENLLGAAPDAMIFEILNELGVPGHLSGRSYLRRAILIAVGDFSALSDIRGRVYEPIAQHFGTTLPRIERSVRFAVESAWNRGRVDVIENLFGYTVNGDMGRPTNSEFIAMVAERVRLRLRA